MSDEFIREVDEELRRDQVVQFWKKHSGWIGGMIAVVVLAVAGYNFWIYRQTQTMHADAGQYNAALSMFDANKRAEAESALGVLTLESSDGYALLGRFRLAASKGSQDAEAGASAYDALAADAMIDPVWRDLATLRAAALRIDGDKASAAVASLEKLAVPAGPWRHSARELLFAYAVDKGDYATAARLVDQIAADSQTPADMRSRLPLYSSLVAGGAVQTAQ